MVEFKNNFIEHYSKLIDIEKFKEYCLKPLRKSIRVNTLKISVNELKKRLKDYNLEKIPWIKEGFFVGKSVVGMGNLVEHSLGYFYMQEAASMIPPLVLDVKEDDLVLDVSAAPGSKTTQMGVMMKNKGLIVANDIKYERLKSLQINLQRAGISNTIITLMNGHKIKGKFDKILLDAPCSGTGAIRKSLGTLKIWNPNMNKKLSMIQKKLLLHNFDNLNEDGELVYSTCSVEPEENEKVIEFLLENKDAKLEKIDLDIKRSEIISDNKEVKKCLRIWPQDNDTEGFFVAKIKKS